MSLQDEAVLQELEAAQRREVNCRRSVILVVDPFCGCLQIEEQERQMLEGGAAPAPPAAAPAAAPADAAGAAGEADGAAAGAPAAPAADGEAVGPAAAPVGDAPAAPAAAAAPAVRPAMPDPGAVFYVEKFIVGLVASLFPSWRPAPLAA
jgi:hypothetical protein